VGLVVGKGNAQKPDDARNELYGRFRRSTLPVLDRGPVNPKMLGNLGLKQVSR
jgi:hypothetical protein